MTFEHLLPRLATAYHQGLLVPFIGAGMSRKTCPDWKGLIGDLERAAGAPQHPAADPQQAQNSQSPEGNPSELIVRANAAIRQLSLGTPTALRASIHRSLYGSHATNSGKLDAKPTASQTRALAKLWWPLIVSSNYDDLFAEAYEAARREKAMEAQRSADAALAELTDTDGMPYDGHLQVLGRSRKDCARLLSALSVTAPTVIWAIHGFLPRRTIPAIESLESEMVVGHDEYRRIAHADPYYRRAFGELWRQKSLLFLGSSLGDPYLLDLFSEVQELHGTNPQPHYALVEDDKTLDEELLRTRFNIIVARYGKFDDLSGRLEALAGAVDARRAQATRWGWNYTWDKTQTMVGGPPDLEIVRAYLPTALAANEGIVVSAGFPDNEVNTNRLFFSPGIRKLLNAVDPQLQRAASDGREITHSKGIFFFDCAPALSTRVAAIRPWKDASTRDLNLLSELLPHAFDWAAERNILHLHVPMLGAGASRHFPASVALSAMVRAHKRWRDSHTHPLRLTIHAVDVAAVFELTSGRLNVTELLTTTDLRFWIQFEGVAEVVSADDRLLREPAIVDESMTLSALALMLRLPDPGSWEVCAEPSPVRHAVWVAVDEHTVVGQIGLSAGATLKMRRRTG